MAAFVTILKTDSAGVMSVVDLARGTTQTQAEAQASRLRLKDEACSYCVYTGIFKNLEQASEFVRCRNAGMSIHDAIRHANPDLPRSN